MFLVRGTDAMKEHIEFILSSVDLKHEVLLLLLDGWMDLKQDMNIREFHRINRLTGTSKYVLTRKYELMKWFLQTKFSYSLPCMLFTEYNESTIQSFMKHGSKHKFLKASDGFAGKGIKVVNSITEIKEFTDAYRQSEKFKGWILQDALETIATFQTYKFHLRVVLVVVVHNNKLSVYMSNYHTYVLSNEPYDVGRIKEETVYNTHIKQNTKHAFFPMELPDGWAAGETTRDMKQITQMIRNVIQKNHIFRPDWSIQNGYELLGVDVVFDKMHRPYILEINEKMAIYPSQLLCFPELFHLALGGSPMKLFSLIYGTSEHRTTPFTKPLSTFYGTQYTSVSEIQHAYESLFHTKLQQEADRAYLLYQSQPHSVRTTRKKHRSK